MNAQALLDGVNLVICGALFCWAAAAITDEIHAEMDAFRRGFSGHDLERWLDEDDDA